MSRRQSATRPRRTTRRWHIPPPLIHGPEALESGAVLDEVGGALGLVLWRALRDVTLWAQCPPAERHTLFSPGTEHTRLADLLALGVAQRLGTPLEELAKVVGADEQPGEATVSVSCRNVAQWAEENGHMATALGFAQAAALVCPGDQLAALNVGRIARENADHARAEIWYRRTIGLAREARDWRAYTEAFIGLGNLYVRRGNYPEGRRLRLRALRGARRGGMRRLQAVALHDLFALEVDCGNVEAAERYARQAFEAYGPRNKRLSWLANDLACLWIDQGCFARALRILRPLLQHAATPELAWARVFLLTNLARAAGGVGDRATYVEAAEEARRLAAEPVLRDHAARVHLDLSRGASSLGDWKMAEESAARALEIASERWEGKTRLEAESILDQVRRRETSVASRQVAGMPEVEANRFAEEFAEALEVVGAA